MDSNSKEVRDMQDELNWITLDDEKKNSFWGKVRMRSIVNPFVPIGCFMTSGILAYGLYNFYLGNKKKQNKLMRYRVLAQGITLGLAVFTIIISSKTK